MQPLTREPIPWMTQECAACKTHMLLDGCDLDRWAETRNKDDTVICYTWDCCLCGHRNYLQTVVSKYGGVTTGSW